MRERNRILADEKRKLACGPLRTFFKTYHVLASKNWSTFFELSWNFGEVFVSILLFAKNKCVLTLCFPWITCLKISTTCTGKFSSYEKSRLWDPQYRHTSQSDWRCLRNDHQWNKWRLKAYFEKESWKRSCEGMEWPGKSMVWENF